MTELEMRIKLSDLVLEQYSNVIMHMIEHGTVSGTVDYTEEMFELINMILERMQKHEQQTTN